MTVTWSMIAWGIGLLFTWTGILLGAIKYLLNRQISAFEAKLAEADAKANKALAELSGHKQTIASNLSEHKQALAGELTALRIEFERKAVCGNHSRMEDNDKRLFQRLDQLHGDIRELVGGVKGLANSLELVNQHLLSGGK
jgi:ABC-type transporter Mla subunit MlaD